MSNRRFNTRKELYDFCMSHPYSMNTSRYNGYKSRLPSTEPTVLRFSTDVPTFTALAFIEDSPNPDEIIIGKDGVIHI